MEVIISKGTVAWESIQALQTEWLTSMSIAMADPQAEQEDKAPQNENERQGNLVQLIPATGDLAQRSSSLQKSSP